MKKGSSEGLIDFNVDQTVGDDLLIAEGFVRLFSEAVMKSSPKSIDIFNYNIQKAKILLGLSYKIMDVLPLIVEYSKEPEAPPSSSPWIGLISGIEKAIERGSASYFVFTEQAVVTSVSATEIYYRDRLAESINSDLRIAKRFANKEIYITIDQLFQIDFELKSEIGIFLVEKIDFQKVDNSISSYEKAFGNKFGNKMLNHDEIVTLKKIFEITSILTPGYWDGESYQQISDVNKTEVQLMRWNKDVCRCVKLDELKEYEGKTVTVTISVED